MQNHRDYLHAAQTFHMVQSQASDSNQQAEAIYRLVSCGDAEAKRMGANASPDSLRQFQFGAIGIDLVYVYSLEGWANADTSRRQLLASAYSKTPGVKRQHMISSAMKSP